MGRSGSVGCEQQQADVFVIFGITDDLAKVMTFRSLYRLERRGLLQCPVVGVAVNDWTVDQLVERARESITKTGEQLDNATFERFAAQLSRRGIDHAGWIFCAHHPPLAGGDERGSDRDDQQRERSSACSGR